MNSALSDQLRALALALGHSSSPGVARPSDSVSGDATERALIERLTRDLLPRTAGGQGHLVVGIVGPNNAGKSALFNSLTGRLLSPSLPTGGATRRLVGALHPDLLVTLEGEPVGEGLRLVRATPGASGIVSATEGDHDPAELLVAEEPSMPVGLLLVDTPDFDSVARDNRLASEALLQVVDLAVVVVTRHTYQNATVVHFLERWLAHGRPWALVYNESIQTKTTAEHAAKLAEDVGSEPLAVFHSPFQLEVAEGRAPLDPRDLSDPTRGLRSWLFDDQERARLKDSALESSLAQLADEWRAHLSQERSRVANLAELEAGLRTRALSLGGRVARDAMPMGPFLEAFRVVLDRRPGLLPRGYRGMLGKLRGVAMRGLRRLPWVSKEPEPKEGGAQVLVDSERAALASLWPLFYVGLAKDLGAWPEDPRCGAWVKSLEQELQPSALVPAGELMNQRLAESNSALLEFQMACEARIEEELEGRQDEWVLQLAVDVMHLLPAAVAGLVIVKTGGLGADVAVGGAGALSTLMAERVSRLLGSGVAASARERWGELRGSVLAELLLECALPAGWPSLGKESSSASEQLNRLEPLGEFLHQDGSQA